ncbi:PhzF family phenazine biosynthesis protein [Caenimonas koreensis]|uniref:PhzF family phenazine biosynthesis isomerase n=1 Tax=Caenimonas koreensis DSM 17982 TaxID=1121255 RepID=A0A844AZF2_9BURK|nr:PhzF family phenazine biosynthesis protein [Caenimonas koreensis]MRD49404.1 PhzF family phenazine biosynthesis isomerase [Caenimonas koreensis DSM 17982]
MQQRDFKQVDVFTGQPYLGNPLAVVLDAAGLTDEQMQHFARWTNLSETTFLLPPTTSEADYRVRIMTPGGELPFAGHPTLGSCHAWLEAGGKPRARNFIVQECKKGLVTIRREPDGLAFAAPELKRTSPSPAVLAQVASALGLKASQIVAAQILDNGPAWFSLLLDSPQTVLGLTPNHLELKNLGCKVGVAARHEAGSAADLEVRAFAAAIGIPEDPVTGSLNAGLAQWLIAEGHMSARYIASQGVCLQRAGRVAIERGDDGQVWVGGQSVTCVTGSVLL